jgi:hypothetical protein
MMTFICEKGGSRLEIRLGVDVLIFIETMATLAIVFLLGKIITDLIDLLDLGYGSF